MDKRTAINDQLSSHADCGVAYITKDQQFTLDAVQLTFSDRYDFYEAMATQGQLGEYGFSTLEEAADQLRKDLCKSLKEMGLHK